MQYSIANGFCCIYHDVCLMSAQDYTAFIADIADRTKNTRLPSGVIPAHNTPSLLARTHADMEYILYLTRLANDVLNVDGATNPYIPAYIHHALKMADATQAQAHDITCFVLQNYWARFFYRRMIENRINGTNDNDPYFHD